VGQRLLSVLQRIYRQVSARNTATPTDRLTII
jgi:hypothetical protein